MNLEGDLSRIRLPKVLLGIGAHGATGILTVQGEEDIVAVSFVDGGMVTADALNQTVEEGLGRVLQAKGWLVGQELQKALRDHQGGSAGSLGDHLVEGGLIDRDQLLEALREQTLSSMMQLLGWKTGEFKFYSGDEVSFEEGFLPISVDELLVSAIDRLGERVGLVGAIPSAATAYRQVPPRGPLQIFGRDGDGMSAGIWVTQVQADFLSRVDGKRSASDIVRELGMNRFQAQFTLYYLTQYDLIEATGRRGQATKGQAPGVGAPAPAQPPGPAQVPGSAAVGPGTPAPAQGPPSSGGILKPPESGPGDLKAEVFRPPDDLEDSRPRSRPVPAAGSELDWAAGGLAAVLLLALVLVASSRPISPLLPFPWQETARSTAERHERDALYKRIDRAARTYFLLEAHYPDSLTELVDAGMLSPTDLDDPAGYEMSYTTDGVSYRISLQEKGQEIEGLGTNEAITGDFLVDPQFLSAAATAEAPLVLLD